MRHSLFVSIGFLLASALGAQSAKISGPLAHSPATKGGDVLEARYTPDGTRLVYRADQDQADVVELYSVLADGSAAPIKLSAVDPQDPDGIVEGFQVASTSQRVVFIDGRGRVCSAPLDGSAPAVQLVDSADFEQYCITPDGSAVVYPDGGLYVRAIDGASAPLQLAPPGERVQRLALTPDGTRAVFTLQQCFDLLGCTPERLVVVPLDGSQPVLDLDPGYVIDLAIAPDSSRVVFRTFVSAGLSTLNSVPIDGSAPAVELSPGLVANGSVVEYALSPNSDRVVYRADQEVNEQYELYSVLLDGSAAPVRLNRDLVNNGDVVGFSPIGEGGFQISSDGARVVYRADERTNEVFELFSVPIEGGFAVLRSGTMVPGGDVQEFQIGPDSVGVMFRADRLVNNVEELFAAAFSGGLSRLSAPLPPGGRVLQFKISPDNQHVVYRAIQDDVTHSELHRVSNVGGAVVTLGGSRLYNGGSPLPETWSISPDSSRVAYVLDGETDALFELFGVPILGGVPPQRLNAPLTAGPVTGDVFVSAMSSDGGTVVYTADGDVDDVNELYRVSTTGGTVTKLNAPLPPGGRVRGFVLTLDGTRALYIADQDTDGVDELYSVLTDASAAPVKLSDPLPPGGDVHDPLALSPDGERVLYLADGAGGVLELHATRVDGSEAPIRLSAPGQSTADNIGREILVTPDGSRVVFRGVGALYSVPLDGSQAPVRLTRPFILEGNVLDPGPNASPEISPDSRFVAYLADAEVDGRAELFVVPVDGSRSPVRLNGPLVPGGDVLAFRFAAGGARVVYRADEELDERVELFSAPLSAPIAPRVRQASLAGRRAARVKLNAPVAGAAIVEDFELSPDGSLVAFTVRDGTSSEDLFVAPVDRRSPPTQLTSGHDFVYGAVFTQDGGRIVYDGFAPSGLYVVPIDGSTAPLRLGKSAAFRLTPDGLSVVFCTDEQVPGQLALFVRPLDASAPAVNLSQPFTTGTFEIDSATPLWITPDSGRVVYCADHAVEDVMELYSSPLP